MTAPEESFYSFCNEVENEDPSKSLASITRTLSTLVFETTEKIGVAKGILLITVFSLDYFQLFQNRGWPQNTW